jgi:hypothetical protein
MADFDVFAAQAMLYFATVSFAEVSQRIATDDSVAWNGFLGVGDPVLDSLPRESLARLRAMRSGGSAATARQALITWIANAIAPRNIAGLFDPLRHNLYPVDFDVLLERHALLGMTRQQLRAQVPSLRGARPAPILRRPPNWPVLPSV